MRQMVKILKYDNTDHKIKLKIRQFQVMGKSTGQINNIDCHHSKLNAQNGIYWPAMDQKQNKTREIGQILALNNPKEQIE